MSMSQAYGSQAGMTPGMGTGYNPGYVGGGGQGQYGQSANTYGGQCGQGYYSSNAYSSNAGLLMPGGAGGPCTSPYLQPPNYGGGPPMDPRMAAQPVPPGYAGMMPTPYAGYGSTPQGYGASSTPQGYGAGYSTGYNGVYSGPPSYVPPAASYGGGFPGGYGGPQQQQQQMQQYGQYGQQYPGYDLYGRDPYGRSSSLNSRRNRNRACC